MRNVHEWLANAMVPKKSDGVGVLAGTGAAAALAGIGALHLAWGLGSTFPAADARSLARAVVGGDRFPSPGQCVGVAVLLGAASVLIASRARPESFVGRVIPLPVAVLGSTVVASVLAVRGFGGLVMGVVGFPETTPSFRTLDLIAYSPLCVALAVAIRRSGRAPS